MNLKDIQDLVALAYSLGIIDDTEFASLYDLNAPTNPCYPYANYGGFDFDSMDEDTCWSALRMSKLDVPRVAGALGFTGEMILKNGSVIDALEAFCLMVRRLSFPCRYFDMVSEFGRTVPQMCMVFLEAIDFVYERWGHLLHSMNQQWLSPPELQKYADAISHKGAGLGNCWGLVDGTVRPICRPGENQRILYNGHKRLHAIKFQSVVAPNGLIANLYGPVEGRRHDSFLLAESDLLNQLMLHSRGPQGNVLCIYGDPAYPLRPQLMCPFQGAALTPDQRAWNTSMCQVRIAVEWIFSDIVNQFKFVNFKDQLKIGLSPVGKFYVVSAILHNARSCLYPNRTSTYFDVLPPILEEYFV